MSAVIQQHGKQGRRLANTLGMLLLAGACGAGNERQGIDARPPDAGPCSVSFATPQEIAATPREDPNLELLALQLGERIVADQAIYDRIVTDVSAMRDALPPTGNVQYWALDDGKRLSFNVDGPTLEAMRDGLYAPWEPSYDTVKRHVIRALEGKTAPVSGSDGKRIKIAP